MDQASSKMLPKTSPVKLLSSEILNFSNSDPNNCIEVTATDVTVNSSGGKHTLGSSKVKLTNFVNFNWEQRLYYGQILAVHMDGLIFAYSIKGPSPNNLLRNGMVRVAHRSRNSENKAMSLLKGFTGQVQDLNFAHIQNQALLASIDEGGNIFIHKIELLPDSIFTEMLIHIEDSSVPVGINHRVVWCPYIPDDEDSDSSSEDDASKLLVSTHGTKACVWNIKHIFEKYGFGVHSNDKLSEYCIAIQEHTKPIVEAAFSPDGSALATASLDGNVLFFQKNFLQVYEYTDTLRCLFKWSPHDGKPLSCLFFLDSHVSSNSDQFWKHAVTGCDNNSILKIWSCKSWVCLQTITFAPSPDMPTMALKAGLDKSAEYLLLSDINRRILFVLNLDSGSNENGVYCKSISEFLLHYPILSFGVIDAGLKALKCPSSCSDPYHQTAIGNSENASPIDNGSLDDHEHEDSLPGNGGGDATPDGCNICVIIRLYLVQPKCLQKGTITFHPIKRSLLQSSSTPLKNLNDSGYNNDRDTEISPDAPLAIEDKPEYDAEVDKNSSVTSPLQSHNLTLAQQSQQLKNILMRAQLPSGGLLGMQPPSPHPPGQPFALLQPSAPPPPLNLMTPDAFNSPAKQDEDDPPITFSPDVPQLPLAPTIDTDMQLCSTIDNPAFISTEQINSNRSFPTNTSHEAKLASGGSSPSREVQEILSLKGSDCFYEDLEDEFNDTPPGLKSHTSHANSAAGPNNSSQAIPEGFQRYNAAEADISLKGSDCFYEDDLEDEFNHTPPGLKSHSSHANSAAGPNNSSQVIPEGFQRYNAAEADLFISPRVQHLGQLNNSKQITTSSSEKSETIWPSINMEKINEANQRKANSEKSNSINKSNSSLNLSAMNLEDNGEEEALQEGDKAQRFQGNGNHTYKQKDTSQQQILTTLQDLALLINEQRMEITKLRGEVSALKHDQNILLTNKNPADDGNATLRLVEQALQKNQANVKQLVDTAISSRVESDRANREALLSGVSQIVGGQIADRLNTAVAHEARSTLVPGLERILEPVARELKMELARTLSTTDHLLTENIHKLVNSKAVMDNLCLSVAHTLSSSTKEAFKEAIQTSLVPSMEKAQSEMFNQINQTFNTGIKQYLLSFGSCTRQTIEQFSVLDETCQQISTMTSQLQHVLDQQSKQSIMNTQTQQSVKQLSNMTKDLQTMISKTLEGALQNHMSPIKECIREQISSGMAAHAAQLEDSVLLAVRSRTQTPAPAVVDMQTQQNQIDQMLAAGQMNSAFQLALSASDLRLVVHACAAADTRRVFSSPCPLQQHVLLSLIQQLGADMNSDTQLKHRYLEEAVMNLDNGNPVTREHMPLVLKELHRQLANFISCNPYNEATRNLKVLLLAIEALVRPTDGSMSM